MSLAIEFDVSPGAVVTGWVAACHFVGACGAWVVADLAVGAPAAAAAAPAILLAAGLSLRRSLRTLPRGRLAVDRHGAARWWPAGSAAARPFEPRRWIVAGDALWVRGLCDGRTVDLLSGGAGARDPSAAGLRAWLRWLDRGGAPPAGALAGD